jgi:hypothetical protein
LRPVRPTGFGEPLRSIGGKSYRVERHRAEFVKVGCGRGALEFGEAS